MKRTGFCQKKNFFSSGGFDWYNSGWKDKILTEIRMQGILTSYVCLPPTAPLGALLHYPPSHFLAISASVFSPPVGILLLSLLHAASCIPLIMRTVQARTSTSNEGQQKRLTKCTALDIIGKNEMKSKKIMSI